MARDTYFESTFTHSFTIAPDENGTLPTDWRRQIGYFRMMRTTFEINPTAINRIVSFSDFELFSNRHRATDGPQVFGGVIQIGQEVRGYQGLGDFAVTFADGFDSGIFDYRDFEPFASIRYRTSNPATPVPIVISESVAALRGLGLGDSAVVGYSLTGAAMYHFYAVVAGIHNEQIHLGGLEQATIIPMWAYNAIFGFFRNYSAFVFSIDPAYNRELNSVRTALYNAVFLTVDAGGSMEINVYDSELVSVINSMEQSLLLLELLYPIAIMVSVAIGGGLSMLILMQNAKNAAIMRALGTSPARVRAVILIEQLLVVLAGLVCGLAVLAVMGWGLNIMFVLSGLYMGGVIVGSTLGAVVVTRHAPLDMLQARE